MGYELIIKEEANLEIIDSYLFYESKSKGLGEKFLNCLETHFDRIKSNPEHYRIKIKSYREVFIKKFPYSDYIRNHWQSDYCLWSISH